MTDWSARMGDLPLLGDGPVGDWLRLHGLALDQPPEALNLERPETVSAGHRAYGHAGAALHRTNTLGANRVDLAGLGLAERCEAINNSGSAALRQAVGSAAIMAGRIGPVAAAAPRHERERAYGEQAIYLSDTGADVFLLEHFPSVEEATLVLRAIRDASDAPAMALLTFDGKGRTAEGLAAAAAGRALLEAGAEALGVSCAPGGAALAAIVEALRPLGATLGVMLSLAAAQKASAHGPGPMSVAAQPRAEDMEAIRFAEALAALAGQGVAIVGGCCGVLPAHIRAAAKRLGKANA